MITEPEAREERPQRIAIIGGGIAGLTAAYDLTHDVPTEDGQMPAGNRPQITIFEAGPELGGLAAGFRGRPEWEWPLEHFYHHLFTSDDAIFGLTDELGLADTLELHDPTTVMHYKGSNYPFDSPSRLLRFPHLSLVDKVRMGLVLAYLRYHPNPPWRQYDKELADQWLSAKMGQTGYAVTWQPMLQGKFGAHYDQVNLAWFWARIYKRTPKLGYYRGGFQAFVDGLADKVRKQGVEIRLNTPVSRIDAHEDGYLVRTADSADLAYDAALCTVSPGAMQRMVPGLPQEYLNQLQQLTSIGAVVLTIALDRQLLRDNTYWVNVPKQEGLPFLALVEHTNMIDPSHYDGDHLLYIGDYLDPDHRYFELSADELLAEFAPHLKRFNPYFNSSWIKGAWVHSAKYAQPVPPVGYADMIPDIRTPLPGLYFASMSQVYPWDRGTNYAVEMGRNVAKMIKSDR